MMQSVEKIMFFFLETLPQITPAIIYRDEAEINKNVSQRENLEPAHYASRRES